MSAGGFSADIYTIALELGPVAQFSGVAQPHLSPPRQVRIAGQAATAPLSGVGQTPLAEWTAPALGTPERYTVVVYELVPTGGQLVPRVAGQVLTKQTSARLPPGLVGTGGTWVLSVQAEVRGGLDVHTRPFWSALPTLVDAMVTSTFTP